jgi:hypothetical protein
METTWRARGGVTLVRQLTRLLRGCTLCSRRGGQGFKFPQLHREVFTFRVFVHVGLGAAAQLSRARTRAGVPDVPAETSRAIAYGVSGVWAGRA